MKINKDLTPDDVYDRLREPERTVAFILRELIRETLPDCTEKLSWGAPFYFGKRSVCFVWPASIPWGKVTSGVALGFTRFGPVTRTIYHTPEEIDIEQVKSLLRKSWSLAT